MQVTGRHEEAVLLEGVVEGFALEGVGEREGGSAVGFGFGDLHRALDIPD